MSNKQTRRLSDDQKHQITYGGKRSRLDTFESAVVKCSSSEVRRISIYPAREKLRHFLERNFGDHYQDTGCVSYALVYGSRIPRWPRSNKRL